MEEYFIPLEKLPKRTSASNLYPWSTFSRSHFSCYISKKSYYLFVHLTVSATPAHTLERYNNLILNKFGSNRGRHLRSHGPEYDFNNNEPTLIGLISVGTEC